MARKFKETTCISCGTLHRIKSLKKINKKFYCKSCVKQLRKQRRKETIKLSGIKDDLRKLTNKIKNKWTRKHYAKMHPKVKKVAVRGSKPLRKVLWIEPTIKNSKKNKKNLSLFLTKEEKQILFRKYIKNGLSYEEADERILGFVKFQKELLIKLKKQNKTEEQINQIFKQEFWKLYQE